MNGHSFDTLSSPQSNSLHSTMTSKLPTRKVGSAQVSAIGYGAMGISTFYGAAQPDEERFKVTSASFMWRGDVVE